MKKLAIVVGLAAWCGAVAAGAREIYAYSTEPGARADAPARWPTDSTLTGPDRRPGIVMFVHPECPCSRASLTELAAIATSSGDRASIQIVLTGAGDGAWDAAGRVPGATRILDPLDREAKRFGARTSGHLVVYDGGNALRYAGGITGSRGHAGNNVGRQTVERIVSGSADLDLAHAVFGCALGVTP